LSLEDWFGSSTVKLPNNRNPGEQIPEFVPKERGPAASSSKTVIFVKNIVNCAIFYPSLSL
jgi:hypothetical protein